MNERWEALRSVFDSVAEEYDEVRSGYPEELVASALTPFEAPSSIRILAVSYTHLTLPTIFRV